MASARSNHLADVVAALGEVIRSQQAEQHEPTPTEYFALILSSISSGKHDDSLVYQLQILGSVIPSSAASIVRSQFKQLSACLLKIAKANAEDERLLQVTLEGLGNAMQVQDHSDGFWGAVYALQSVNAFLTCLDDGRFRIRKTCTNVLTNLLRDHQRTGAKAVRSYIGDFCIGVMKSCTRSDYKRSLYVVLSLESNAVYLPDAMIPQVCETALRLQICEQPLLTAAVCRMVDALFQNSMLALSAEKCRDCVNVLLTRKPATVDMEANTYFFTALGSALVYLHKKDSKKSLELLPVCISALVVGCDTDFTQIHCAVGSTLKRIIGSCLDAPTSAATTEVIREIESLLQLKFQRSWLYVMDAVRSLFDRFRGNDAISHLRSIIVKLADLYHAVNTGALEVEPGVEVALADTLGAVLRSCGVVNFLSVVPFTEQNSPVYVGVDKSREWILTLLHNNLKLMKCKLSEFGGTILPAAGKCSQAVQNPAKYALNDTAVQTIRTRVLQLWSLLPDFMYAGPGDVAESFPRLAKILESAMTDEKYPEIIPHIVVGLTHLAKGARDRCPAGGADSPEVAALRPHAQVFMPAVLMFLENSSVGDNNFQAGVQFVAAWAAISPPNLIVMVSKKLLQLLLTSTGASAAPSASSGDSEADTASVWMAVVQAIIPHMPETMVSLLYRTVRPLLSVGESVSLQKRAYNVLDSLLHSHLEVVTAAESRMAILSLISESLLTCQVSARSMRLRCMETLMEGMEEDEVREAAGAILGEVLICQKDANKKTRDSATELLLMMIRRLTPYEMLTQLCSGLAGETSVMRSATVTGLCLLLLERRDDQELMESAAALLPTVCILLRDECPEESRAVLSFVRVCAAVLPNKGTDGGILQAALPHIVFAFSEGLGPHKTKFSTRVRAIMRKLHRRVDTETLRNLLSEPDRALLTYIERRARKAARLKDTRMVDANRIDKMLGSDSEDSDDEDNGSYIGGGTLATDMRTARARSVAGTVMSVVTARERATASVMAREDPRLGARPKATKSHDMKDALPAGLEDLLEDKPSSLLGIRKASAGKERLTGLPTGTVPVASSSRSNSKSMHLADVSASGSRGDDEDEEYRVAVTADGRVVVQQKEGDDASDKAVNLDNERYISGGRKAAREEAEADAASARRAENNKRPRLREPGEEYRSKKAGGDVWKRGMLEPHAYIPLDPRMLTKKSEKDAVKHFGVVIKAGKKAAPKASAMKKFKGRVGVTESRARRRARREHSAGAR